MDDYKALANSLKDEANDAFQKGEVEKSIGLYTQAIEIDPDNHVLYSNRSAAYMKQDSKSKALKDAERCVELAPEWTKGYNRLGVAQQSLKRFDAAMDSFKKGLQLEPSNTTLWAALSACQEAYEKDKGERYAEAAREREKEEARLRRADEEKRKQEEDATNRKLSSFLDEIGGSTDSAFDASKATSAPSSSGAGNNENDLLSGFFSEIASQPTTASRQVKAAENASKLAKQESKYATHDLGDPISQFKRLTQSNYQWRNLNPYYVLQLGIDATDEDVKQRYKSLSRMVHPDKLRDMENAREAFEQVKSAYQKLQDEKQRNVVVLNIEYVLEEFNKERRRLLSKGLKEADLPPYEEELEKRTIKHFAEIEMQRRRSEANLRFYNARERIQEDAEKERARVQEEKEEAWAEVERRESRVSDWRQFQDDPEAKRVRLASYKEEHRTDGKHGQVKLEEWKKNWK